MATPFDPFVGAPSVGIVPVEADSVRGVPGQLIDPVRMTEQAGDDLLCGRGRADCRCGDGVPCAGVGADVSASVQGALVPPPLPAPERSADRLPSALVGLLAAMTLYKLL